jgi:hypothetical protein
MPKKCPLAMKFRAFVTISSGQPVKTSVQPACGGGSNTGIRLAFLAADRMVGFA